MTDWAITVPKSVKWEDYELELKAAADGAILNFRIPNWVGIKQGDRVFVVWNGRVRGWHRAIGYVRHHSGWRCSTTAAIWPAGHYIQRTGVFHLTNGPEMGGFRGIRRVSLGSGS